jgi:hypothetical protein
MTPRSYIDHHAPDPADAGGALKSMTLEADGYTLLLDPKRIGVNGPAQQVAISPTAISLFQGSCQCKLTIDPDGGDLIVTAVLGPNAGKSVNLTYGKWA